MPKEKTLKVNQGELVKHLTSVIASRAELAGRLGLQYNGNRDIYTSCGLKKIILVEDYENFYRRMGIAKRVVRAFPDATWRAQPNVYETDEDTETAFEKAWNGLVKTQKVWNYLSRIDRLSGVGRYGVLLLGFDDGLELSQEVKKSEKLQLVYMQAFGEWDASISKWEPDTRNKRFGLPVEYNIIMRQGNDVGSNQPMVRGDAQVGTSKKVHWSRIIHIAENCDTSDVYGESRLECVFNDLTNLEKILACAGEGFWRACFAGISFEADKDVDLTQTSAQFTEEIDAYTHDLQRYMRLQGITAKPLSVSVGDPRGSVETTIQMISAATGIPQRILTGSERGEMASTQDRENWNSRVDERRKVFAEPFILRAFIDRLIDLGALPEPTEEDESGGFVYIVEWPEMVEMTAGEKADLDSKRLQATSTYINGGIDAMLTPQRFMEEIWGMSPKEAETVLDEASERLSSEEMDMEEGDLNDGGGAPLAPGQANENSAGENTGDDLFNEINAGRDT